MSSNPSLSASLGEAMHTETFDVITSPDGTSTLHLNLCCATVLHHYTRCTRPHSPTCSTGLRVYEGAAVMAALLAQHGHALLHAPNAWVVELGCGCGLAGFTALHRFPHIAVAFTDAADACLTLVEASARHLGVPSLHTDGMGRFCTHRLLWGPETTSEFFTTLTGADQRGFGGVQLILGTDLMYYRVDMHSLLSTCRELVQQERERLNMGNSSTLIALAHFMRIADGKRKLQMTAYALGFGLARVPLEAIVREDVVRFRGWNGIDVVLLFLHTTQEESSHVWEDTTITDVSCSAHRERRDVEVLREILKRNDASSLLSEAIVCYSDGFVDGERTDDGANGCNEWDALPQFVD